MERGHRFRVVDLKQLYVSYKSQITLTHSLTYSSGRFWHMTCSGKDSGRMISMEYSKLMISSCEARRFRLYQYTKYFSTQ